jgi:hypothetical protein
MNKIIELTEGTSLYNEFIDKFDQVTEKNLIIVARSARNRKDPCIDPIEIKNDVYFYAAYTLPDGNLAFPTEITEDQIRIAKENTVRNIGLFPLMAFTSLPVPVKIEEYDFSRTPAHGITSVNLMFGAGILLCPDFLRLLKEKLGEEEYWIVQSSIHELLIFQKSIMGRKDAIEMVVDVNRNKVSDQEFLANTVWDFEDWI